jgi:anaerobic selenocysteine-containing dehydrogenase
VLAAAHGLDGLALREQYDEGGPERLLDFTLRTGTFGDRYGERPDGINLGKVKAAPNGIDLGPNVPALADVLQTTSGKVVLAPPYITADLPRLAARLDRQRDDLVLISRRHLRSNNSWMHNVNVLVKGKERCTLLIHPRDATRCDIRDGRPARITSDAGSLVVTAEVTDAIKPGVVSLPHGWGHGKPRTQLSVANEHAGVNTNELSPGTFVDAPSGNAAVNGIPVTVSRVERPG